MQNKRLDWRWLILFVIFLSPIIFWNLPPEKADFMGLEEAFAAGDWRVADQKTRQIVIALAARKTVFRQSIGKISPDFQLYNLNDLERIDCKDIRRIDSLWNRHSQGRFGWSVQQKIWQSLPKPETPYEIDALVEQYKEFGQQVGWRNQSGYLLPLKRMTFDITAPTGHLPSQDWTAEDQNGKPLRHDYFKIRTMFNRVNQCSN